MTSSRKKKEKKKDFVKQKLKVGKTKPKSTSHTDTSFKARTITLPNQSIVDDGKSITHYLQLLSHHSHKTRNQTLLYIKEHFIEKAASENAQSIDYKPIILKSAARLTDEDKYVRKSVVDLFSAMPSSALDANSSDIMMYVRSAMTHINPDIRATSTGVIDLLMQRAPQQVCRANFASTMKCFISLLGWQELFKAMEAERAKGISKKDEKSLAGANSIIAASSLELVGSMIKARASHVKSLGLFVNAGVSSDYGQEEEELNGVGGNDETGSDTDTNGAISKHIKQNETNTSGQDSESYQPLSEAEAQQQINKLVEDSFNPRHIAAAIKARKSNETALKFLVPDSSMPFLSLNLFGSNLNNTSGLSSNSILASSTTKKSKSKSKSKARNMMFSLENTKGLEMLSSSPASVKYDPNNITVTEDIESRLQLVSYYKSVILEGLNVMIKEGGELGRATKKTMEIVDAVQFDDDY